MKNNQNGFSLFEVLFTMGIAISLLISMVILTNKSINSEKIASEPKTTELPKIRKNI